MKVSEAIGRRIRHCRRLTGLTRKEFCERHNIGTTTYYYWERGEVTITEKIILLCTQAFLAEGLNCSSHWLLTEEGESPSVLFTNNRHHPEKFFERSFENISPEISAFLDVQAFQKNNPSSIVHQIKNKAMLPLLRVGDFVGGVPLEKNKLHFAHREICILETEPKKYMVRIFHKQKNNYVLVAANTSAAVINPLILQEPPISVIPVNFIRKAATSNLDRLDGGEDE
jgi:transcriptional regulator with XRE-family HTH domain